MCQKEVKEIFIYRDEPDGYLMTNRQGVWRFQCFSSEKIAKDTLEVWNEKGNNAVFVSAKDLEDFYKSKK